MDPERESFSEEETEPSEEQGPSYKKGDEVLVRRSSGDIEEGWTVTGINEKTGDAIVQRPNPEGKGILQKEIPQEELHIINERERTFSQWHLVWMGAGGDSTQMFPAEYWTDEKISAEEAWKILRRGRIRLAGDRSDFDAPRKLFGLYFRKEPKQ